MRSICVTNDDGPHSRGLLALVNSLSRIAAVTVIVPDGQRSATGKGLTLNRPLRMREIERSDGYRFLIHDGTPADSVVLASHVMERIDLVVSGINAGGNLGYQSLFTSGTVGAAYEAALRGHPAVAVSMETTPDEWFDHAGGGGDVETASRITADIVARVLRFGLPEGIDLLNLNFPSTLTKDTKIVVTRPTRVRHHNRIDARVDPYGRRYFWFVGEEVEPLPGTDAHVVLKMGDISISPIVVNGVHEDNLEAALEFIQRPLS
ncbi:MAG: 5'/3'-nucleotidase SurE [Candidatus Thorarchaeota archaeon]